MEILKFDESGPSSPSRKPFGRSAILVTFVALVFGAGTALASGTLAINTNNQIALDQGVAQTVQCDEDGINVALGTSYQNTLNVFQFSSVTITNISNNCLNKYFTIKVYDESGNLTQFCYGPRDSATEAAPDARCISDSIMERKVVGTSLVYNFSFGTETGSMLGEPGSETLFIRVKTVTVESADSSAFMGG
jgi:hypothetical protein